MTCEAADTCGNGTVETGEVCDDGNLLVDDGCDGGCLIEDWLPCGAHTDCRTGACVHNICVPPLPSHCDDAVLSGDETAVDCGGSCVECAGGKPCTVGDDCSSFTCTAGVCEAGHCGDGLQSGDELGVDCGGSCGTACVSYDCASQTQIPMAECEKLKDYYNALDGPNWGDVTDWFSDTMPCGWTGITCSAVPGNVQELRVLETLQHGVLPRGLDVWNSARHLQITAAVCCSTDTDIRGPLPPEIFNLSELVFLSLRHNRLSGVIPSQFASLINLSSLDLSSNQLSGTIPREIDAIVSLTQLYLYSNQLVGSIPTEIGNLANLSVVWLQLNQLTGSIPPEIGALTNMTRINLGNNQLSGPIPAEIVALVNLTRLTLRFNQLQGSVPDGVTGLSMLTNLDICPQLGQLTSGMATGDWLRMVATNDWPAGNAC